MNSAITFAQGPEEELAKQRKELGLPFKEPIKLDRKTQHKKNKWYKKYAECKKQAKKDNKKPAKRCAAFKARAKKYGSNIKWVKVG